MEAVCDDDRKESWLTKDSRWALPFLAVSSIRLLCKRVSDFYYRDKSINSNSTLSYRGLTWKRRTSILWMFFFTQFNISYPTCEPWNPQKRNLPILFVVLFFLHKRGQSFWCLIPASADMMNMTSEWRFLFMSIDPWMSHTGSLDNRPLIKTFQWTKPLMDEVDVDTCATCFFFAFQLNLTIFF